MCTSCCGQVNGAKSLLRRGVVILPEDAFRGGRVRARSRAKTTYLGSSKVGFQTRDSGATQVACSASINMALRQEHAYRMNHLDSFTIVSAHSVLRLADNGD